MCKLCSGDEKERLSAKQSHLRAAERMRNLAQAYEDMAYGQLDPHKGQRIEGVAVTAKAVIRDLVDDWV